MKDETEFMDDVAAAERLQPRESSKTLLYTVAFLIFYLVVWASVGEVDQLARGQGQVVPSAEIQVVQSLEGGIIEEILVAEGDRVQQGQVLVRLSDIFFASEERGTEARFLSLGAKKARLSAEAGGTEFSLSDELRQKVPDIAENELRLYESRKREQNNQRAIIEDKVTAIKARLAETDAEISRLANRRSLLNQELDITRRMVAQRAVPEMEKLRLEREVSDASGRIREAQRRKDGLEAEQSAAQKELADLADRFRSQALSELNEVETQIAALEENLKSIGDRVERTEVRAPVDGIVNNIPVKTIGGILEPAQPIVEIVPMGDDLKITARMSPNDIAFLELGQQVNVKITAYDPLRYGSLPGTLQRVSANSVEDRQGNLFFEVDVRTDRNYLGSTENPLPITPGMVAMVEVVTGKRTVMEYLLEPILRARAVALTER